jgi:tetratricopeptide (TPR) repeat protein
MGDFLRNLTRLLAVAAIALPAAAFDGPTQKGGAKKSTAAQKEQQEAPEGAGAGDDKSKTAALVQQAFDAGIKAYGVGKNEEALRAFEAAIRGGLPSAQMPRMLYYRGLAFRKLGKPGFAVSDLTSALWLKPGLSEAERADAIKVRALAYNEAGISNVPPVPKSSYTEAPTLPGQNKPDPAVHTAMAGSALAASDAPAAPTPSSSSGGVTGFFSNLFGGGSSSSSGPPPPAEPSATASIDRRPAQSEGGAGWGGTTEVAPTSGPPQRAPEIASPFVTQIASVDEPKTSATDAAPVARSTPSGKFKLQVAAVRTRSEAEALAGLVVGRHAEQLAGRKPEVDETIIGSMGTFYRVRLGPYANADEPEHLCVALRSDGFDCLVVTP